MRISRTNAVVLAVGMTLVSFSLVGCSSAESSAESPAASQTPSSESVTSAAPVETEDEVTYCEPLAAAYLLKPPSGEPVSDAELLVFGEAMVPVADAAAADGRQDLADMFTLIAKVNMDPEGTTDAETTEALNEVLTFSDEVTTACAVDLLQ